MERKRATMDGNHAAAHVAYFYTDVAAIYPITPSSVMAEVAEAWAVEGRKNIFGNKVEISEMQSEAGAAGAVHGALTAGALSSTFTASQGLLLMIPNLYKIAGEGLPGVFHVAARTVAAHALSIFGDHSDIYACRQTGAAMLCESSVQEVMDLSPVAHCAAIEGRMPFINFFDGFRTSHEIQKISVWDEADLRDLFPREAAEEFRKASPNPEHPCLMGQAQNPDTYFQVREASNEHYNKIPALVESYMKKVNDKIGTNYHLFNYYGASDAKHVIIAMGSVCETIEEAVDYLITKNEKVGMVKVHLYRPFCSEALVRVLPKATETISVLDRTKEPGGAGEPLYLDVLAALKQHNVEGIKVFRGRYGLSSKNTTPGQILAVFENKDKKEFTIGIRDDVTNLSLEEKETPDNLNEKVYSCKFWGLGADGTVGANKNSVKIIGNHTDLYAQAYFDYDSKKSGGLTVSHLRFGKHKIRSPYLVEKADFVACHKPSYLWTYNMVQDVVSGGIFLLNCPWKPEEVEKHLPKQVKRFIYEHHIQLYVIDGVKIGQETGMGTTRINTILQAAFFKLTNILPQDEVTRLLKEAVKATYGKKGDEVVQKNYAAIDAGMEGVQKVEPNEGWVSEESDNLFGEKVKGENEEQEDYVNNIQRAVNAFEGNKLPVSVFVPYADGHAPSGTTAFEKRNVAVTVPNWIPENCIQCNICSYVCPHSVIRPAVLDKKEREKAPSGMRTLDMTGEKEYQFAITVSVLDCTGCGNCAACCPAREKALVMEPVEGQYGKQEYFNYGRTLRKKEDLLKKTNPATVKGSQFRQPLLEFHGACPGCGESAYAKLATQLFGDRMYIANATGCSSIWGNSSPATSYTINEKGQGPVWSNSLFEDAAEFGMGMLLATDTIRGNLKEEVRKLARETKIESLRQAAGEWISTYDNSMENKEAAEKLIGELLMCQCEQGEAILKKKDFLVKKSQWIFGGDGFAYDIGFGGLDHVLASGRNINILIFDTEVYSNTGGQASKSTPRGAIAQFAAGGKEGKKKDLASMAMSYGDVFVAQVAMGADYNQCVRAFTEAENYNGPSLILAYAPCINQGIKAGMMLAVQEEKKAVETGHWHLFRYQPPVGAIENPVFHLDSKKPSGDYMEFLKGEVRFNALMRSNPDRARELFEKSEKEVQTRYEKLSELKEKYPMPK
ncbi:MAG: pyruvate:ferredoxin (flavodoxin) oxidoreductase [Lachnospiraceae bacterium]|nr:pyruvate:ferredoxin (flavodoxin) oxidoreductase [Lachnospiraceae bacterium]